MKQVFKKIVIGIVLVCICFAAGCVKELDDPVMPDTKEPRILFIGNSFVQTGNVPEQLKKLSAMYGYDIKCFDISRGGADLSDRIEDAKYYLEDFEIDIVIIQDYGGRQLSKDFSANVKTLCNLAREYGAVPVLYNPPFANLSGVPDAERQKDLTAPYVEAAKNNKAFLINAADAWVYAYLKHPNLRLYASGDYHANVQGAYLTACVFASTLFNLHIKDVCTENKIYYGENSLKLGQAAWEFVQYFNEHNSLPDKVVTVADGANILI